MARKKKETTELSEPITAEPVEALSANETKDNNQAALDAIAYLLTCPKEYPRSPNGQWWNGYNTAMTRLKEILADGS